MKHIMVLARIFSRKEWAEDFIDKGKFRMNTLNSFKSYKDEYANNVGDQLEGVISHYLGNHDIKLTMKYGDQTFDISDFESIHWHNVSISHQNIFCMFAPSVEIERKLTLEEMTGLISLQKDAEKLGEYMVIILNSQEFFNRFSRAVDKMGCRARGHLIEYRDFTQPVSLKDDEIGFVKRLEYAHQNEYRIMLDTGRNTDEFVDMEIGTLNDIAILIDTKDFNDSFKIEIKK